MSDAARPRKRARTGCLTCRQRRVKCDEGHPRCSNCTRLTLECGWGGEREPSGDIVRDPNPKHNESQVENDLRIALSALKKMKSRSRSCLKLYVGSCALIARSPYAGVLTPEDNVRARETNASRAVSPDYTMNRHTLISSLREELRSPEDSAPGDGDGTTRINPNTPPTLNIQTPYPSNLNQDPASSSSWFSLETLFEPNLWTALMEPTAQTGQPIFFDPNALAPSNELPQISSDLFWDDLAFH